MADSAKNIHTLVSPSLHPQNVETIAGYEKQKGYLNGVLESLSVAYEGLASIHKARLATEKNPTLNQPGRLLVVAQFAEKVQTQISKKFDRTLSDLDKSIGAMEEMLTTPLETSAGTGPIPTEIRAHVKALPMGERQKFLNDALNSGDTQTMVAILGAPNYLTGISEAEKKLRTRAYHEYHSPETASRLQATRAGREMLLSRSALVFGETERALGSTWPDVAEIREAKNRADKALVIVEGV